MCLAVPGCIEEIHVADGVRMGRVRFGGVARDVVLELVPAAREKDYVLVHVGFALSVLDEAEAKRTYALLEELGALE